MLKKVFVSLVCLVCLVSIGFCEGVVNWGDNVVTAKGNGMAPASVSSEAQAKLLAKRAAMVDAYRGLAEAIEGIRIDAKTTVKDLVLENDKVDAQLSAFIKSAQIVSEDYRDGAYTIEMQVPLNGDGSIASIVGQPLSQDAQNSKEQPAIPANGVDYEDNVITATGQGLAPAEIKNRTQAKLLAKRAAMVDAYRNLAEVISGVQIDSQTTVENLMLKSDSIRSEVSGFIKGAKILNEKANDDGSYTVVLGVKIFGEDSLADIIMPAEEDVSTQIPEETEEGYTGLIVDASGLKLGWAMSPKILDTNGKVIYGNIKTDPNYIKKYGTVDYVESDLGVMTSARAGLNPLVVKAVKVTGDKFNTDPVVSVEDAAKIIEENKKSNFLERMKVVFLL